MKLSVLIAALLTADASASRSGEMKHHHNTRPSAGTLALQKQTLDLSEESREFVMHRNMVNERELRNGHLFTELNDKFSDEQFIDMAIQKNQKIEEGPDASKESLI